MWLAMQATKLARTKQNKKQEEVVAMEANI
jgi:hypothetical protein